MSGSGRKHVSKWDSKEGDIQQLRNDYTGKPGSYNRDKDPEQARFYPEGNERHGSRRSGLDGDDDEHMKSRQHSGEAWPFRGRVSHEDGDAVMGYYDSRKSFEQDERFQQEESRQHNFRQSPSRDRTRTRSGSRSNSRSRSRSPLQRVRRDGGGSYDRQKTRVSPRSRRDVDDRYNRAGDYDWEARNKKTRATEYYTEDSREHQPVRVGGRTDNSSDFPEDNNNNNNSRRETSDPISRSHRNEPAGDGETQRRDAPKGEFNRTSNVPCRFFASGNCRNGNSCRFSHHGVPPTRSSHERKKPHNEMISRHDNNTNNHSGATERTWNSHRWNDTERSGTGGKSSEDSSKTMSEAKGNKVGWLGDMEMSPDWNYGVKTLKKPIGEEHGVISQSSQSRVPGDTLAPGYENGPATISQQDGNQRNIGMLGEKTVSSSHHNLSNNIPANSAPPVQAFNQNIENHSAVPYQSTSVPVGGSQVLLPAVMNLPGGLNSNNPQNTVSREELNHISNISASLAQFFGNGKPIQQLHPSLNPKQAMPLPEVCGSKEQSSHTQSSFLGNHSGGVPAATPLQINNIDTQQMLVPDNLVSLAANPKASFEENRDKKTEDEEASKEKDGTKIGEEEGIAEEAEKNRVEEGDDDGTGDENKKKEKDPKGMKAFKFALVEIVKELLKPAWKEGGMNKDAYKNIVKKVVDKVTGAIQTGSIPQTQDKIDHYLSASKPKLTKLVQAYISKVKKS